MLISDSGIPLISDFGLSRIIDSQVTNTATSFDGRGCLRWHAPELLDYESGRPSGFTACTDVYAYACVILEASALSSSRVYAYPFGVGFHFQSTISGAEERRSSAQEEDHR